MSAMRLEIGWPELIVLTLMAADVLLHAHQHGRSHTFRPNVLSALCRSAIMLGLLYWGGFFV